VLSVRQLHGLDLGFVLKLRNETTNPTLDFSRFTRLQKLQLRDHDPARASPLGWRLGLPLSLRVLHLDGLEAASFMASLNS
jgi:hypothetical protein